MLFSNCFLRRTHHILVAFNPPQEPAALQAFYDYSVRTYTHLPSELCHRRPRRNSRPSPYGSRTPKKVFLPRIRKQRVRTESMEQAFSCILPPVLAIPPSSPSVINRPLSTCGLGSLRPNLLPSAGPLQSVQPIAQEISKPQARQRVASKTRRSAFGWTQQHSAEQGKHAPSASPVKKSMAARLMENQEDIGGEWTGLATRLARFLLSKTN